MEFFVSCITRYLGIRDFLFVVFLLGSEGGKRYGWGKRVGVCELFVLVLFSVFWAFSFVFGFYCF